MIYCIPHVVTSGEKYVKKNLEALLVLAGTMKMRVILLMCGVLLSSTAPAYEPDVTQQRDESDSSLPAVAHLIPSGKRIPENQGPPLYYIARFGTYPSFSDSYEWCVFRKDRRYILASWRLDTSDRKSDPRRVDLAEIDVPEPLAATIYTIWANGILDAKYARQGVGLDGTSYSFSTFLRGVGWPSATTWSPDEDLPPKWLVGAGEDILAFARSKNKDSNALLKRLQSVQRALAGYKRRAQSASPEKTSGRAR